MRTQMNKKYHNIQLLPESAVFVLFEYPFAEKHQETVAKRGYGT